MRRLFPAILLALVLPRWADAQSIKLPEKALRDTFVEVTTDATGDSILWLVDPPSEDTRYGERSEGKTLTLVGQPGKYRIRLIDFGTKPPTVQKATLTIVDVAPVPTPPVPPPVPPPAPTPVDPDIVIIDDANLPAARLAATPQISPLLAVYVLDVQSSTPAQAALKFDPTFNAAQAAMGATQRNYDDTSPELTDYGLKPWVDKYGVPCILWQRTGDGKMVAVTKNPTREKAISTLKTLRGVK